jgi:hypothetical protein
MTARIVRALLIVALPIGIAACGSDDRGDTAREKYCYTARLDFARVMRTAADPALKPQARASARSLLTLFVSNGDDWLEGAPRRLAPDSRLILQAARTAAAGSPVTLEDAALARALQDVSRYADRCQ